MIPSTDYSYIGTGSMLIREFGSSAPFLSVGNCSELNIAPQEEKRNVLDYTQPGGNKRNEVSRLTGVDMSWRFHDFSAENFGRGLRADVTEDAAGTATDEPVVAYKGGYSPLDKIATSITAVKDPTGVTTYTPETDYELRDGVLFIPSTSAIPAPVAGAANVEVTYAYAAQKTVQALVNSNKNYEVLFVGLNEARSGKRVQVHAYKVNGGVLAQMALIGDEYGVGECSGSLLPDGTKTGAGVSQYFKAKYED